MHKVDMQVCYDMDLITEADVEHICLAFPDMSARLFENGSSLAILLNDGQLDYSATRRILDAISDELGIGQVDFLGGGLF